MQTKIIEATNGPNNWGKMLLGKFDNEWSYYSAIDRNFPLLRARGWSERAILVLDLETGEGAIFTPPGCAKADLEKHKIWVCPLFEHFLEWLYMQDLSDIEKLPNAVDLKEAPFQMHGYRRSGIQVHSQEKDWFRDLPKPKRFNASNSIHCPFCSFLLAYTYRGKNYGLSDQERSLEYEKCCQVQCKL